MSRNVAVLGTTSGSSKSSKQSPSTVRDAGLRVDPAAIRAGIAAEKETALVLRVFDLVDHHRLDEMVELLTPDVDFLNPLGRLVGRDAVTENFEPMKIAFPNSRHVIPSVYVAGKVVTLEGEWTGTNSGPLSTPSGQVITGRTVRFPFAAVCTIGDGLLSKVHIYHDLIVMFRQLGLR